VKPPRYTAAAISDLSQIWDHHAERASLRIAEAVVQRIDDLIRNVLAQHPLSGRPRPELSNDVRSFPTAPYVVFYLAERRCLRILRILHGHRDVRPPLVSLLTAV